MGFPVMFLTSSAVQRRTVMPFAIDVSALTAFMPLICGVLCFCHFSKRICVCECVTEAHTCMLQCLLKYFIIATFLAAFCQKSIAFRNSFLNSRASSVIIILIVQCLENSFHLPASESLFTFSGKTIDVSLILVGWSLFEDSHVNLARGGLADG